MSEQHQNLVRTIEKQRARIEALEAALRNIAGQKLTHETRFNHIVLSARAVLAALAPEQDK